jgi:hypothetical protein
MELVVNAKNGPFCFRLPDRHSVWFREDKRGIAIVLHVGKERDVEFLLDRDVDKASVTSMAHRTIVEWPMDLCERLQSDLTSLAP